MPLRWRPVYVTWAERSWARGCEGEVARLGLRLVRASKETPRREREGALIVLVIVGDTKDEDDDVGSLLLTLGKWIVYKWGVEQAGRRRMEKGQHQPPLCVFCDLNSICTWQPLQGSGVGRIGTQRIEATLFLVLSDLSATDVRYQYIRP